MGGNCFDAGRDDCRDPKDGDRDADYRPIITPRLILRDLQTANDLEALEQSVTRAAGDEATAEAMYQLASYQFEGSTLLFYNPVAWQAAVGQPRYWNLSQLAAAGNYRTVDESRLLFDYMQQHETPARALRIYLDIVKLFPRTRAARDALYTAAVCHERLSGYNPYWRDIYENRMHAGDRMVTYADVKATYPNYQLPRGTLDWQPSTRTVNNGPGFEAPPKPPVRLTRRERARLFLSELKDQLTIFWRDTGKRWVTEIIIVCGLLLTMRIARRHQRRLRARMARRRLEQAKQVITYPWFELFWIDPELPDRRERARQYLRGKQQEFMALARDGRTRPVLWRSIASHAVATGLIVTLLWTIWFG
jgi:hypothetical protein